MLGTSEKLLRTLIESKIAFNKVTLIGEICGGGFVHSGSPLPFVYDMADLYKEELCIDLAFSATLKMAGKYDKGKVASEVRKRVIRI